MALKEIWNDLKDSTNGSDGDVVSVTPINKIAHAVIELEEENSEKKEITIDAEMSDESTNAVQNKVIKEYVDSPKQIIQFNNGLYIESREDGIYLVDPNAEEEEDNEIILYSGGHDSYVFQSEFANWASEANDAYYAGIAYADDQDRPLKGTGYGDYNDRDELEYNIMDGYVSSYGVVGTSLIAYIYDSELDMTVGFTSGLYFTTPSEIPDNYSQFPDIIYFKGDSTDEGAFVPEPDTRYTIVFDYDGNLVIGYVSGVPSPPVSEVTE